MDLVDGPSLARILRNGPLPAKQAATYLKTIAEAIHFAHARGIIHRDLKPANILIDSTDQPRITDFGLAKNLAADSSLTATGQVHGSPSYMPPEQASGDKGKVGVTSDVYGLGAMLYHMLAGRPPFVGQTAAATLHQVETAEPLAPHLLNAGIPRDLETICLKCLEKDTARRYASTADLAGELDRFLRGEPILARPASRPERLWRWARRNPTIATSAAIVCAALAASLLLLFQVNRARDKEKSLTAELKQALKDKDVAGRRALQMVGQGLDGIWSEKNRRTIDLESEDVAALSELPVIPVTNTATALRLRIGIVTDEDPKGRVSQFSEFLAELEQKLGSHLGCEVRINVRIYKFRQDFGADLLSGRADFGRLGARQYLQLRHQNQGLTPLAIPSTHFKGGVLFTRTNSGIRSINGATGRRFAFGDTNSTISFWAQIKLAEQGITATNLSGYDFLDSTLDFADEVATSGLSNAVQQIGYLHSHAQVIEGVLEDRYDIGVAAVKAFNAHAYRGLVEIPNSRFISSRNVFVARPGLDSRQAKALADTITAMKGDHLQQLPDATRQYITFPPDAYATEEQWFQRVQELFPYKPPK